jgi:small-conductance mechanosensitive channel
MATLFGIDLTILSVIVIAVVTIIIERLFTTYLSRFAKRAKMERNAANNLVLTFRILILIGAVLAIYGIGGLPPEWILSISAIAGAALGFASQKTLGNFIAGLFLLAAHPFKVGDYVRLGTVEGVVQEVTINYTKVLTIGNNTVSISNLQILDRDITNYIVESRRNYSLYCYTFELGFDHTVSTDKMASIFSEVFERVGHTLPKPPFASLMRSDPLGRVYTVYLYVEHPEDVFTLRPQISEEVFKRRDMERKEAAESAVSVQEQAKMPQERMTLKEEKDEKQRKTRSQNN